MSASKREKKKEDILIRWSGGNMSCLQVVITMFCMGLLWMLGDPRLRLSSKQLNLLLSCFPPPPWLSALLLQLLRRAAKTHSCKEVECVSWDCTCQQSKLCVYKLIRMEKDWKWRPCRWISFIPDAMLACFDHVSAEERKSGDVICRCAFWPLGGSNGVY